jgi:hypothetical protein
MPPPAPQCKAAFICGCGHSGTTLVATMLADHPDVFVPLDETSMFWWDDAARTSAVLADLRRKALAAGRTLLVEKTPRHVRRLDRLRQFEPEARLILMTRDGRDVAASIGKRLAGDFQAGVDRWIEDNNYLLAEAANPLAYLLRYEDLIADPRREVSALCEFLGLPFDPAMLQFHERRHTWFGKKEPRQTSGVGPEHQDLRNWQVSQPIFDGRGAWKDRLPPEFAEQFQRPPAAGIMRKLGYDGAGPGRLSGPITVVPADSPAGLAL